jgi:hypothetical protein
MRDDHEPASQASYRNGRIQRFFAFFGMTKVMHANELCSWNIFYERGGERNVDLDGVL